ncbi:MAG: MGMT family protein, partial [Zetaproteobacteria bacterium]
RFRTYGEIAGDLDSSPRAVGQALGANRLPLIVPCHRILAATGLGGFSAGHAWKRKLVAFEQSQPTDR